MNRYYMSFNGALAIVVCSFVVSKNNTTQAQNTALHSLTIRTAPGVTYSAANADTTFAISSMDTLRDDGSADWVCDHSFSRDSNVSNFTNPSGWDCATINFDNEMTACKGREGFVKVVSAINICGGQGPLPGSSIIGCASNDTQSNTIVVVKSAMESGPRGPLVNHEFGHTTGLGHRTNNPRQIMNDTIDASSNKLSWDIECPALRWDYQDPNGPLMRGAGGTPVAPDDASDTEADEGPVTIEQLARRTIVDSTPYYLADRYSQKDADTLVRLLGDPSYADNKPSIVGFLAIISDGRESHASPLIELSKGKGADPVTNVRCAWTGVHGKSGQQDSS
ncbi:MAG TPA: hypothetical protein VK629_18070 [Steroidobacteraceae bacterium]|nr:hypothetical protein [Steroidobacteraceae bacterium]